MKGWFGTKLILFCNKTSFVATQPPLSAATSRWPAEPSARLPIPVGTANCPPTSQYSCPVLRSLYTAAKDATLPSVKQPWKRMGVLFFTCLFLWHLLSSLYSTKILCYSSLLPFLVCSLCSFTLLWSSTLCSFYSFLHAPCPYSHSIFW